MIDKKIFKIAIASGKGGTGKTLISTNLSTLLSQNQKVLLVDLDVEEPNDFIFIKGRIQNIFGQHKMIPKWDETKCTLCGKCSKICKFHAVIKLGNFVSVFNELCHSCYACSELCPSQALPMSKYQIGEITQRINNNLTFIESRLKVGEEQAVPLIHQTHDFIDKFHNNILLQIFDCPPGTACSVVASVKNADFVILVTEPTPFGLNDLKLAVETMKLLSKPIGVIINRYDIGNNDVEEYCNNNDIPIIAKIPFDREIAEIYSNGELAFEKIESLKASLISIINYLNEKFIINE